MPNIWKKLSSSTLNTEDVLIALSCGVSGSAGRRFSSRLWRQKRWWSWRSPSLTRGCSSASCISLSALSRYPCTSRLLYLVSVWWSVREETEATVIWPCCCMSEIHHMLYLFSQAVKCWVNPCEFSSPRWERSCITVSVTWFCPGSPSPSATGGLSWGFCRGWRWCTSLCGGEKMPALTIRVTKYVLKYKELRNNYKSKISKSKKVSDVKTTWVASY